MHICCRCFFGKSLKLKDLFICKIQLFLIELIIGSNSSRILVHDFLHGFLKLLNGKCRCIFITELFVLRKDFFFLNFDLRFCGNIRFFQRSCGKLFHHIQCCKFSFCKCPCYIFLGTSACNITCCIKTFHSSLTACIYPVAAGCMTAYDIRLCSLDLHILLAGALSAFDPFQSLARCHVEISLQKIFILFLRDPCSLQVTRAVAKLIFPNCSVNSLACGQSVFCLIDLASCIDLFCADTLCDGSRRSNGILAAKCDKTHLKGRHLRTCQDSHCISGTCVKRRIPHLMSGKSRIVRLIKSGRSACCSKNCLCPDNVRGFFHNRETNRSVNLSVFYKKVCDIYIIQNVYVLSFMNCISKKWFKIFTVDLDVTVSSGYIITIFILQDHKPKLFHLCSNFVEILRCCKKKVLPYDPGGILCCIIYIILRLAAFYNVGIDCINTCCQTAASSDICFFCDQYPAGFLF